jgi:hypothetical protein
MNYTSGRAAASLTSTAMTPETGNDRVLQDEEECKLPDPSSTQEADW